MNRKEKGLIRHSIYVRARGKCEKCNHFILEEAGEWSSMHLSHTKSKGAGGNWDPDNLMALCIACHLVGEHNPKSVPSKGAE